MSKNPRIYALGLILVILASFFVFLAGNGSVCLWDRDEPRYAQTSKQMLLSSPPDWIVPRLLDTVRTAKPVLVYWCQAASMKVFGVNDFAARFPSAFFMTLTLILMGSCVWKFAGARRAFWTTFILGACGLVIASGKMAITDGILLFWITLSQILLFYIYVSRKPKKAAILLGIPVGFAILAKGPVALGVMLTTLLLLVLWERRGAWLKRLSLGSLLVMLAISLPWLIAVQIKYPGFLQKAVGHDVLNRATKPLEGHKGPPGFYLAAIWGIYMPWSMLLPATFVIAWKNRRFRTIRFALCAIAGPWVMMECVQTKMVHYILPVFPPLAFLTADLIVRALDGKIFDLNRKLRMLPVSIQTLAMAALGFAGFLPYKTFPADFAAIRMYAIVIAVAAVLWAGVVFVLWLRQKIAWALIAMGVGMWMVLVIAYAGYLPRANFMRLPLWAGQTLRAHNAENVLMYNYQEDSLFWYQGGTIRGAAKDFSPADLLNKYNWVVIDAPTWKTFPQEIREQYEPVDSRKGWQYADKLRDVELLVMKRKP